MITLIHLSKKDFAFAKPWILGTWFAIVAGNVLPSLMPGNGPPLPWAAISQWIPALLIFLTSTRIIHCDPLIGATGFMPTRPVRPTTSLGGKLAFIGCALMLPAALFPLLHPVLTGFRLSGADYILLFLERGLFFSVFAAAAVMISILTRNVGAMALVSVALVFMIGWLLSMANGGPRSAFGATIEDAHLSDAVWLVMQAFLTTATTAVAISWAAKRRWPFTATVFLLNAAFLVMIGKYWKWNFVEDLAKDASIEQIMDTKPSLKGLEKPRLVARRSRESIPYAQVIRPYRIEGLKDGWNGNLVKSKSEARFVDGKVWQSSVTSSPSPFENFVSEILPQLGIEEDTKDLFSSADPYSAQIFFECEKRRLLDLHERSAKIRGIGRFQLNRPFIAAELPTRAGATAFYGRSQYRIEKVSVVDGQISVSLSSRGIVLKSKGDGAGGFSRMNLVMVNPKTKQFTRSGGGSGSASAGDDWKTIERDLSLAQHPGDSSQASAEEFLEGALLYVITVHYGGTIDLPYELPEMLLEEKR